ncbi:MAG: hypothetical protein HQK89_06030 [Nitrospirae bacterium]|nr:hypothetical protein [Nitrospirota bacterium]
MTTSETKILCERYESLADVSVCESCEFTESCESYLESRREAQSIWMNRFRSFDN